MKKRRDKFSFKKIQCISLYHAYFTHCYTCIIEVFGFYRLIGLSRLIAAQEPPLYAVTCVIVHKNVTTFYDMTSRHHCCSLR